MAEPSDELLADVAAYRDNSDYDEGEGSTAKAELFRSACRRLLMSNPSEIQAAEQRANYRVNVEQLPTLMRQAGDFIASKGRPTSAHRTLASVTKYRDY